MNEHRMVFRYNESKDISTLDPAFARNQVIMRPVAQLFNGLVQMNDSLQILPCIAKSWTISQDGLHYTFILRNDVYFHDNKVFESQKRRKVTAHDFVYSFNRIVDPKTASPGAWIFNVVNAAKPNTSNGFKAVNDSVFEIWLKRPFPAFMGILTMQYCSVIPHEAIDYYGNNFRSNPVGTGPFMLKMWVEGEKLVLMKNENYFETDSTGNKLPYINAVAITFVSDKQSEFMEFIKGRSDFITGINSSYKDELLTRDGELNPKYSNKINMLVSPYLNTEYFGILNDTTLNIVKNSPLKSLYIRMAINLGFDRVKMMAYLRNNIGYPATSGFVPKGMPSFSEKNVKGYTYNPDSAAKLLALAGYPHGKGLPEITLTTTSDYLDLCEFFQQQLSEIGIKINIEVATGVSFRDMMSNSKLLFFRASWVADYPDAENYLSLFYSKNFSPNGPNYTHFSSKEFDALYEMALKETNVAIRNSLYNKMDQLIVNESIIVPVCYDKVVRFVNKKVKYLGVNPLNQLSLKQVVILN